MQMRKTEISLVFTLKWNPFGARSPSVAASKVVPAGGGPVVDVDEASDPVIFPGSQSITLFPARLALALMTVYPSGHSAHTCRMPALGNGEKTFTRTSALVVPAPVGP